METKYYFINDGINDESIYGDIEPYCMSEAEVRRLSSEWGVDLFTQMHEASAAEIEKYGTGN